MSPPVRVPLFFDDCGAVAKVSMGLRVADISQVTAKPVGAGLSAMVVNDNARVLDRRGVLETIASRLAPTGIA
ncbi:hypothetical protein [Pseudomonas mohnii]|uniref:hypothetical protein n=1 Tax=Pseudomonas mohnii TaxID=395600 RepID=UPI000B89F1BF|nr:hypothetical protein [Pseudomonas mohnii]